MKFLKKLLFYPSLILGLISLALIYICDRIIVSKTENWVYDNVQKLPQKKSGYC